MQMQIILPVQPFRFLIFPPFFSFCIPIAVRAGAPPPAEHSTGSGDKIIPLFRRILLFQNIISHILKYLINKKILSDYPLRVPLRVSARTAIGTNLTTANVLCLETWIRDWRRFLPFRVRGRQNSVFGRISFPKIQVIHWFLPPFGQTIMR